MKRIDSYNTYFTKEYLMGPNSLKIANELLAKYPLRMDSKNTILELGCGTGLSSLFIARETNAVVHATDLWISEEENKERFRKWEMEKNIIPFRIDASATDFGKEQYDAVMSIDAYHYFAGKEGFFINRILPSMKSSGVALIAVPGIKEEYEGKQGETIREWCGEEEDMFHSCSWWKKIIGTHQDIEVVDTWQMDCFEDAWEDWLRSGHECSINNCKCYENIIKKYTCIIGIAVKKR